MTNQGCREQLQRTVNVLAGCGGRFARHAELLRGALEHDDTLVPWLLSPLGGAVRSDLLGTIRDGLEGAPRDSALQAAARSAEGLEARLLACHRRRCDERAPPAASRRSYPFRVLRGGAAPRDMTPTMPPPGGSAA